MGGNDWLVSITNLSGRTFIGVAFVTDVGNTVANADGTYGPANGLGFAAEVILIDTAGVNRPLVSESRTADGRFEPTETWRFIVNDFLVTTGPLGPPAFSSIGVGPGSVGDTFSNASIVVLDPDQPPPIPEPSTTGLVLCGGISWIASIAWRKKLTRG